MAPTFEITGTTSSDRGAELMAIAAAERIRRSFPESRIVVPLSFGPFLTRGRHGFFTTWEMPASIPTKTITRYAPRPLKRAFGIIEPEEIDVVLDASGFALSDRRGPDAPTRLARKMSQRNRRHQLLILLPQALGPFNDSTVRGAAKRVMDRATLVCARDEVSFDAAASLCGDSKLRRFPDVTTAVKPRFPAEIEFPPHFSAIVPSYALLRKSECSKAYLDFLCHAIAALGRCHLNPVLVVHDSDEDMRAVEAVKERGHAVSVLTHSDPRALKGILGRATLIIGSRFHALFGALSQGVPGISAGETDTCPQLFREFGCDDLVLHDVKDLRTFEHQLDMLGSTAGREARRDALAAGSRKSIADSEAMWAEVEGLIKERARP
jgi:polysaccharide pyruvyl transferase WcaK-like protein